MRLRIALAMALVVTGALPAAAQDHVRFSINAGQQVTERPFTQKLTFQQYFEQADLTLDRTIPKKVLYDVGASIRLFRGLHVGASISMFKANGTGSVTAHVPHPFFFNQPRTATGDVAGINRMETATHIQIGWTIPAAGGIEFTPFAGPSIFQAEQVFVKQLNLTLADEVYPYDSLTLPGVTTETIKDTVNGYNAGVDMAWWLKRPRPRIVRGRTTRSGPSFGLGLLIRYSHGMKDYTPTGGQATKVEVGGLHAGGGVRVSF